MCIVFNNNPQTDKIVSAQSRINHSLQSTMSFHRTTYDSYTSDDLKHGDLEI